MNLVHFNHVEHSIQTCVEPTSVDCRLKITYNIDQNGSFTISISSTTFVTAEPGHLLIAGDKIYSLIYPLGRTYPTLASLKLTVRVSDSSGH